jgi:microsomal epoxide hydrolase
MVLTAPTGDPDEMARLSPSDAARLQDMGNFQEFLSGSMVLQSTRPQTLAYGLTDSPVGQLAWVAEKFREWNREARTPDEFISRDRLLTNVSIYWLTGTAGSSAQLYYESARYMARLFTPREPMAPIQVPIAVAAYRLDTTPPIRAFAQRDYPTITRWSELDGVGHFASLENPRLFVKDVRAFNQSLAGTR